MESLPNVPLLKIAEYLLPEDVARLSMVCRRFYDILPRFLRIRGPDFEQDGPRGGHLVPELYFDGPVLKSTVKSLKSSVHWRDQGWGNRKGRIFVILIRPDLMEKKEVAKNNNLFGIAEHNWKTSTRLLIDDPVVKLAQPGDYYCFMRDPGGGGGHKLYVKHFTVLLELDKN